MKIAYTVWTWGSKDKSQFEQALKEIADLGYDGVENFNPVVVMYEDTPQEFDDLLRAHGLEFYALYSYLRGDWQADLEMAERCIRFAQRHGIPTLNMQAASRPEAGTTKKELDDTIEKMTTIGKVAQQHGVTMCVHPHYGTNVETVSELAYFAENTDPAYVSLCLDTAHTILGKGDPVEIFAKYVERIEYVHIKDLMPVLNPENPMKSFLDLGDGRVDFPGVLKVLRQGGYDGVLCVEQDCPAICNYKTAMVSRRYIREVLGL